MRLVEVKLRCARVNRAANCGKTTVECDGSDGGAWDKDVSTTKPQDALSRVSARRVALLVGQWGFVIAATL
jgi:hypothetical protein